MRIMAIDYGDVRIGLAVSDRTGTLVGDAWVLKEQNFEQAAQKISEEALNRGVERLILGYPKNMDGSIGPRAEKSQAFAELLEKSSGIDVILWDERLTTLDANAILKSSGIYGKKKKKLLDAVAASLILENYLSFLR